MSYFIFGPPAFEIELKKRWLMVNHKAVSAAVYSNGENYSFPLGIILDILVTLGEMMAILAKSREDVCLLSLKISARSWRDLTEILLRFKHHGEISAISARYVDNLAAILPRFEKPKNIIARSRQDLAYLGEM